jgi:hypothetical protein
MNEPKPCKICQTLFTPRRVTDLTCGNPVCRRKRDAANARANRAKITPSVIGNASRPPPPGGLVLW